MNTPCDILVAGGGVSGTAAALASARSGARTVLAEKESFLGGTGYAGLLQYICGLYLNGGSFPAETLNKGIVREITGLLNKLAPQKKIKKIGQVYALPYSREDMRSIFTSLCRQEPNLTVLYNTTVVSVKKKNRKIDKVIVSSSGVRRTIIPKFVIDCSGNGDVSAMAGASFSLSPAKKLQLAGYTIHIKGIKGRDEALALKVPYYLADAVRQKILSPYLRFSTFSPADTPGEGYCKLSIDGVDSAEREQRAKKEAVTVHRYLADRMPSFKDSYIAETSKGVSDREGRRICGEFTLTEKDVLTARKFYDAIVKNSWPIELWDKNKGVIYKYVKTGDYYEIPFRCIKVKGIPNLLCAGRCISVSAGTLGSTRVMGTCITLGEQAGLAAAYHIKNNSYPDKMKKISHLAKK
ncbi:MAG: hypothetical protein FD156_2152 [Nitrospirae bacterium]|nr:MAG: hypothetical protein FD156_2152 [Nitrospirota bacterium]